MSETILARPAGAACIMSPMPVSSMGESEFVSEPITPVKGTFRAGPLASGLASLPEAFTWRGRRLTVVRVLSKEKISQPERYHEGHERYLKKQEFVVELDDGSQATIYFDRQPRSAPRSSSRSAPRWFLYEIRRPKAESEGE